MEEMVVMDGAPGVVAGLLIGGRTSVGRMLMRPVVPASLTVAVADLKASQAALPALWAWRTSLGSHWLRKQGAARLRSFICVLSRHWHAVS